MAIEFPTSPPNEFPSKVSQFCRHFDHYEFPPGISLFAETHLWPVLDQLRALVGHHPVLGTFYIPTIFDFVGFETPSVPMPIHMAEECRSEEDSDAFYRLVFLLNRFYVLWGAARAHYLENPQGEFMPMFPPLSNTEPIAVDQRSDRHSSMEVNFPLSQESLIFSSPDHSPIHVDGALEPDDFCESSPHNSPVRGLTSSSPDR
jgi:hypothetical protein